MTRKLTPAQLDEIEAAAKKATPGPWEANMPPDIIAVDPETGMYGSGVIELEDYYDDPPARINAKAEDLAHIAMMDPAPTLALIAEVRELRAKVERVRALHQPAETVDDGGATFDPTPCTCGHWDYTQCPDRRALGEGA